MARDSACFCWRTGGGRGTGGGLEFGVLEVVLGFRNLGFCGVWGGGGVFGIIIVFVFFGPGGRGGLDLECGDWR